MKCNNVERAFVEGKFLEKSYKKLKTFIFDFFNGKHRKRVFKKFDKVIAYIARYIIAKNGKVQNNKILFVTSRGSYNCNPKGIAEEIIKQELPWELVWVARKENLKNLEQYPDRIKIVLRDSLEFYKEAASAKIWIDNSVNLSYMQTWKKKEQILIETWHGSLGLKRFETSNDKKWIRKAVHCGNRTDYCISNSVFEDELFKNSFWSDVEILKYGHARNDILFKDDLEKEKIRKKVYEYFGIDEELKIVLYAPTFRDDKNLDPYNIDYKNLKTALEKKYGGQWCVLSRLHFTQRKMKKNLQNEELDYVIDATLYEDIQDLMIAADVGITDYSSWICDYMLTRKPAFIFAVDLDDYYSERGFYYSLDSTPFPIARSNRDLAENIAMFDNDRYLAEIESFLEDKGCMEDGHASERIVKKMKEWIGEK